MTPAEYLELERKSETRSEYLNGRMFERAPSSRRHSLIAGNLGAEISQQLRGKPGEAHIVSMRVKVASTAMYAYPDVVAVNYAPEFEDSEVDTLLNPTVLIEVLSPSTEAYDRGEKFAHYRRLDSLREYVLVAQDKIRIEHYRRDGDQWIFSEVSSMLDLPSIDCHVSVEAIYEKVTFE